MRLRFSISKRISGLVIALAAVLVGLWGATLVSLVYVQANALRQSLTHAAQTAMTSVDEQIGNYATLGRVLMTSPALARDDIAAFEAEAKRATAAVGDAWVVLASPAGDQIFSTRTANGQENALRTQAGLAAQQRAFESGAVQFSDVDIERTPRVTVNFAIMRDGKPRYGLAIAFSPLVFTNLMAGLPEHWLAAVIDRKGNYVTRSLKNDELIGQPAGAGWREVRDRTGVFEFASLEGEALIQANVRSQQLGWSSGVAASRDALYAPIWKNVVAFGTIGAGAIALCLALVIMLGRRIDAALGLLKRSVGDLLQQNATSERTGEWEIDAVLDAINLTAAELAAHERRRAEHERQLRLAAREVSHRSKNLLAVTASIATLIGRDSRDIADFNVRFSERLQVLARSQDLLIEGNWQAAPLADIVSAQFESFAKGNVELSGPAVAISASGIQPLCMVFHELATNAVKYGALSAPGGRVTVNWSVQPAASGEEIVSVVWSEIGGPKLPPPERHGFGSTIVRLSVRQSLMGTVDLDYRPDGLVCSFAFPVPSHAEMAHPGPSDDATAAAPALIKFVH
jgi:two-component sensor histidine kinase